ncbi:MAG: hypothetical protein MJZ36_02740 [Bacteroidaceae bacterium]|nr:hypothetical protein [Bacteroidaceae bacterium]
MILHNLTIAWRNLMKYKLQTSISIISLAVGMVCFALSALWLRYEDSYDAWWPEYDDVYMLQYKSDTGYNLEHGYTNYMPLPVGKKIAESNPDIDLWSGMVFFDGNLMLTPESEERCGAFYMQIDEHAQEMFDIKVLEGRKKLVLAPDEVALTRTTAERLFRGKSSTQSLEGLPRKSAVGEKVWYPERNYGTECYLTVVAVVEDPMKPTSFPYDFIMGINPIFDNDDFSVANGFVRIMPENVDKVTKALEDAKITFHKEDFLHPEHVANDSWTRDYSCKLIPLCQVSDKVKNVFRTVERSHLRLFVILGIIVICCAMFNYFTMLVTRIRIRQRELALRYVHGASMGSLITLIATELMLILVTSMLLATGIVSYVYEDFRVLSGVDEPLSYILGWFLVFALSAALASLAITAIIVYVCSRRQMRITLDKQQKPEGRKLLGGFRGILMIVQLAVSMGTVFCSFVMMNQIHFLFSSPDMGFAKHNRGAISLQVLDSGDHYASILEQELKKMPEIEEFIVDYTYPIPYGFQHTTDVSTENEEQLQFLYTEADEHYFRFMELQMVDGEFITSKDDPKMVCINETAARMLGDQGKVGSTVKRTYYDSEYVVKGIVKDLSYMSPTTPTQPLLFTHRESNLQNNYMIDIPIHWKEGTNWEELREKIEGASGICDDDPNAHIWTYSAEEEYDTFLQSERTLCRLLMLVTVVCVLIAVFGMFSTISLACERRRKEVALRKIHGAGTWDIYRLFLREYMYMLIIGGIIAFPIGYYLMHLWQMQYVRQAPVPLWLYPAILTAMALLIFLTVFWQIRKVAKVEAEMVLKE